MGISKTHVTFAMLGWLNHVLQQSLHGDNSTQHTSTPPKANKKQVLTSKFSYLQLQGLHVKPPYHPTPPSTPPISQAHPRTPPEQPGGVQATPAPRVRELSEVELTKLSAGAKARARWPRRAHRAHPRFVSGAELHRLGYGAKKHNHQGYGSNKNKDSDRAWHIDDDWLSW